MKRQIFLGISIVAMITLSVFTLTFNHKTDNFPNATWTYPEAGVSEEGVDDILLEIQAWWSSQAY